MTDQPHQVSPIFSIDVSADSSSDDNGLQHGTLMVALLRQLLDNQERTNQLLEELVKQTGAAQKQRMAELGQWRKANPELARDCRTAAETLSRVQTEFLRTLTEEVVENKETLMDGEFMLSEFVDRFGPRLAHLNGVLQVLSQLSSTVSTTNTHQP